jgi:hypothetical protein
MGDGRDSPIWLCCEIYPAIYNDVLVKSSFISQLSSAKFGACGKTFQLVIQFHFASSKSIRLIEIERSRSSEMKLIENVIQCEAKLISCKVFSFEFPLIQFSER